MSFVRKQTPNLKSDHTRKRLTASTRSFDRRPLLSLLNIAAGSCAHHGIKSPPKSAPTTQTFSLKNPQCLNSGHILPTLKNSRTLAKSSIHMSLPEVCKWALSSVEAWEQQASSYEASESSNPRSPLPYSRTPSCGRLASVA